MSGCRADHNGLNGAGFLESRRRQMKEAYRPSLKEIARAENSGYDRRPLERAGLLPNDFATMASYRKLRNFSKSRPETTNLNHQYISRRAFICALLDGSLPHHADRGRAPRSVMCFTSDATD